MIEVSFPAGFTPADRTVVAPNSTRSLINSDRPVRSAKPSTGTNPAHDTSDSSSKTGVARDHPSGSFTNSAFWLVTDQDLNTPDPSDPEGTST
jgi:hypothetical protein